MNQVGSARLLARSLGGPGASRDWAAPTPQGDQPAAVAKFDNDSIRTGPRTYYPVVGVLGYGQS